MHVAIEIACVSRHASAIYARAAGGRGKHSESSTDPFQTGAQGALALHPGGLVICVGLTKGADSSSSRRKPDNSCRRSACRGPTYTVAPAAVAAHSDAVAAVTID